MRIYVDLAVKDVFRLWSATQLQVVIIAGICLPILMLLGLKNGHVAELRRDLVTSPEGRRIIFYTGTEGDFVTDAMIKDLEKEIPNVDRIMPKIWKDVFVQKKSEGGEGGKKILMTLHATIPGDPLLAQFGVDIGEKSADAILLSQKVADTLKVDKGDSLTLQIVRRIDPDAEDERHELLCTVKDIVPDASNASGYIGYANLPMIKLMEKYVRGRAVSEWDVPVSPALRAKPEFGSYLLFCFRDSGEDLVSKDHKFFADRGLQATEIKDQEVLSLYGTLEDSASETVKIYQITPVDTNLAEGSFIPVMDSPGLLERYTSPVDDFILFWSKPRRVTINGQPIRLVGMTLPTRRQAGSWIEQYLRPGAAWFNYDESYTQPLATRMSAEVASNFGSPLNLKIDVDSETEFPLLDLSSIDPSLTASTLDNSVPNIKQSGLSEAHDVQEDEDPDKQRDSEQNVGLAHEGNADHEAVIQQPQTICVPVSLLAYLDQLQRGKIKYEPLGNRFVGHPLPIDYTQAYLFAKTIDDVPLAAKMLAEKRFIYEAESSRIAEIQQQTHSLEVLVSVVAIGVFIFGVITVFSVLVDSTDRKKGTIGIFRVMGISGFGVFFILLVRALVIGLMAALLCSVIGIVLAQLLTDSLAHTEYLSWVPTISILLRPEDYLIIAIGAVLCACLGVLLPAIKASQLDPFEAIMQGQFS